MVSSSSLSCPLSSSLLGSSSNPASLSYGLTPPPSSHSMTLVLSSSPPGTSPSSPPTLGSSSNPASLSYGSTPPPSSHSMTLVLSSSPPGTSPSSPPTLTTSSEFITTASMLLSQPMITGLPKLRCPICFNQEEPNMYRVQAATVREYVNDDMAKGISDGTDRGRDRGEEG
ncbi:PREDICTED: proline-rich receptor-like protein kinase PERK8 [Prunus mume]|uniref:Proline-rich receptor-like protein kinase PERK8 n=1 Tax=Prunus mume TaxID=102107 RepID=A0ABM0N776_PRUMU|nr:PREDICTED: proline-rich receptor-like protein kinase PERK8 [Prunus mume]